MQTRLRYELVALVAIVTSVFPAQRIFRSISIDPYGTVTLGQPLRQASERAKEIAPDVYLLIPSVGHFGDTDSLLVRLSQHRVGAMVFVYQLGKGFDSTVADYKRTLGPAEITKTAAITVARWSDERTEFRVVRAARGPLRSELIDRDTLPR